MFLIFDLEILLIYPYVVSVYVNGIYGLIIMIIFFLALTSGFAFEIGKGALKIISNENDINGIYNNYNNNIISLIDISNNFLVLQLEIDQ